MRERALLYYIILRDWYVIECVCVCVCVCVPIEGFAYSRRILPERVEGGGGGTRERRRYAPMNLSFSLSLSLSLLNCTGNFALS